MNSLILWILCILSSVYTFIFFTHDFSVVHSSYSFLDLHYNKISVFVGALYCGSLFIGLFPIRNTIQLDRKFLFYIVAGLGVIMANNLPTFFLFWLLHRMIPVFDFIRQGKGGTYFFQHLLATLCFLALMYFASNAGILFYPMETLPASFFTLPVLLFIFVIVYESHGIFPFHSWVHDVVRHLQWYEFSAIFLSRAGVLLFVQMILPTLKQDPSSFQILLLSLSIFSSIYWSLRGIVEESVSRKTTYFYIAQASLLLTGMQADQTAARGSYLHMMVLSISGTSLFAIQNYIQHFFSFKRSSQFYGLAAYYPKVATLFCLFGFCMIGVPLGSSFVVEDLVITGLLAYHPYLGLGHILATCLNGIFFFLILSKIFLGPTPFQVPENNMDMGLIQMIPFLLGLVTLLLIGIIPSLFLEKIIW